MTTPNPTLRYSGPNPLTVEVNTDGTVDVVQADGTRVGLLPYVLLHSAAQFSTPPADASPGPDYEDLRAIHLAASLKDPHECIECGRVFEFSHGHMCPR